MKVVVTLAQGDLPQTKGLNPAARLYVIKGAMEDVVRKRLELRKDDWVVVKVPNLQISPVPDEDR